MKRNLVAYYENTLRLNNVIRQSATTVPLFVCRSSMCMYVCMHHMVLFTDFRQILYTLQTRTNTHTLCM